ncbi:MAG: hypothetical protein H6745_19655 [Deltaproteobacteria bacterium]|nr:hypothetical protein [Deltaproteobacteria bacterium]
MARRAASGPWSAGARASSRAGTPRHVVWTEGASRLLRFRRPGGGAAAASGAAPVLLVPSMLQRWQIFDLAPPVSVAGHLTAAGLDVYCLDWGDLDCDPGFGWWDAADRLRRARGAVANIAVAERVATVGYSQGGTLAATDAALAGDEVAALVNVAGPIDLAHAGVFAHLVDKRWCNADLIADAGGLPGWFFRWTVAAMHPWLPMRDLVLAAMHPDPETRATWRALERWANDAVRVPPEVLRTWIGELYQDNALMRGVFGPKRGGPRARLGAIACPVLTITADRDTLCPREAAEALNTQVSSDVRATLRVPGGHVSGIVGPKAAELVHAPLAAWLLAHARRGEGEGERLPT